MRVWWALNIISILGVAVFVFWICAFKIFDPDFFWHVTAGDIMRRTGGLIAIDPFAYTREGLPYLANHEWLAQIVLSIVFETFGSTGVIVLRSVLLSGSVLFVLLITRKYIWLCAPLAMYGALTMRGGAMDRPHLWTWLMLTAFLFICVASLRHRNHLPRTVGILLVLQILWVNLHGGAALLGIVIGGAFALQVFIDRRSEGKRIPKSLIALPIGLALALMISPLGWENITYIQTLLSDQTTQFIAEWQPRAWGLYLTDLWPFWLAAGLSVVLGRKNLLFSILVLAATGYLSRQAYRHEMLFILAALAVTFMQLERSQRWKMFLPYPQWTAGAIGVIAVALLFYTASTNKSFANRYHAYGYGIVERTADVTDFIKRENITGKIFNTYNLGFELLPGLYPDQKIFVDGRNVDYGEEFLSGLFAAVTDVQAWRTLEEKYGFTIAIIDIADVQKGTAAPYASHLAADSRWSLVYLDDWIAMYAKNAPNELTPYRILTAENVNTGQVLGATSDTAALEGELQRSITQSPGSINARLLLARHFIGIGQTKDAEVLVNDALAIRPHDYRVYQTLGLLRARENRFDEAEEAFDTALGMLSRNAREPIKDYVARIFESLGESERAERYR